MKRIFTLLIVMIIAAVLSCKGDTTDQSVWDIISRPQDAANQEPYSLEVKGVCKTCKAESWASLELEDVDGIRMLWNGPYGTGQCPRVSNVYLFPGEKVEVRLSVAPAAVGGKTKIVEVPADNDLPVYVTIELD